MHRLNQYSKHMTSASRTCLSSMSLDLVSWTAARLVTLLTATSLPWYSASGVNSWSTSVVLVVVVSDIVEWTLLRLCKQNHVIKCMTPLQTVIELSGNCCLQQQWSHAFSTGLETQLFHFDFPQHPLNVFFKLPFPAEYRHCDRQEHVLARTRAVWIRCESRPCTRYFTSPV